MSEHCGVIDTLFGMLVYYDILGKEKARCFRVESTVLPGSYLLLAGAVMLALLNTFVNKATFHYFWDQDCARKEAAMEEHLSFEEEPAPLDNKELRKIRPPPVLFTDTFRWLLRPEHLGDRPLKSEKPNDPVVRHGVEMAIPEKLSTSSGSVPGKTVDVTTTDERSFGDAEGPSKTVDC